MASHLLENAQNTSIGNIYVSSTKNRYDGPSTNSLEKLVPWIAPQAMHDSYGRSDAPKCHPDTRVAVQDEIYSWVVHGDSDAEPKKIKWITGPAGTGKTAIAGSLAERFEKEGLLAATFFFSSSSPYPGQRTKKTWIPTIAHQLAQRHEAFKHSLAQAIDRNSLIFEKNLRVQMDELILQPLRDSVDQSGGVWQKVIIVDGLDECDVDQGPESNIPTKGKQNSKQMKDQDQLEILQALLHASSDPNFPFHIIIASRSERVFRNFFKPNGEPAPFVTVLELDEKYDPDADITLYLEAKFSEIRRIYNLPVSWPPSGVIRTLVENASGQFIYVATVIGFIMASSTETPQVVLDIILNIRPTLEAGAENPFVHLDALYTHILESSPNPTLAVKWLWVISDSPIHNMFYADARPSASFVNQWLQKNIGESELLFGPLHSLIKVPLSHDTEAQYAFYHKSLFDFLDDPRRAGALWVSPHDRRHFYHLKYWDVCLQLDAYPDSFHHHFMNLIPAFFAFSGSQPVIDRWIELCISWRKSSYVITAFWAVHKDCRWYRPCHSTCKKWRRSIVRLCNEANWKKVPSRWFSPFLPDYRWLWGIAVPDDFDIIRIFVPPSERNSQKGSVLSGTDG